MQTKTAQRIIQKRKQELQDIKDAKKTTEDYMILAHSLKTATDYDWKTIAIKIGYKDSLSKLRQAYKRYRDQRSIPHIPKSERKPIPKAERIMPHRIEKLIKGMDTEGARIALKKRYPEQEYSDKELGEIAFDMIDNIPNKAFMAAYKKRTIRTRVKLTRQQRHDYLNQAIDLRYAGGDNEWESIANQINFPMHHETLRRWYKQWKIDVS